MEVFSWAWWWVHCHSWPRRGAAVGQGSSETLSRRGRGLRHRANNPSVFPCDRRDSESPPRAWSLGADSHEVGGSSHAILSVCMTRLGRGPGWQLCRRALCLALILLEKDVKVWCVTSHSLITEMKKRKAKPQHWLREWSLNFAWHLFLQEERSQLEDIQISLCAASESRVPAEKWRRGDYSLDFC